MSIAMRTPCSIVRTAAQRFPTISVRAAGNVPDLGVDAQVNLARGVVVTNTTAPATDMPDHFGPASFHENDYSFFYKNLQDNVAKRIAAYKAN